MPNGQVLFKLLHNKLSFLLTINDVADTIFGFAVLAQNLFNFDHGIYLVDPQIR